MLCCWCLSLRLVTYMRCWSNTSFPPWWGCTWKDKRFFSLTFADMVCLCCRPVTSYMEQWLRLMLRWDPKQRGGGMVQTGENAFRPKCFLLLDQILATKVSGFSCPYELYWRSWTPRSVDFHVLRSCPPTVQCSVLDQVLATKVRRFPCPLEFVLDHCPPTMQNSVLVCCPVTMQYGVFVCFQY